jgi:hypothetical protein
MGRHTLDLISGWALWLMLAGLCLFILTASGIAIYMIDTSVNDIHGDDFERDPSSEGIVYRATFETDGLGAMTVTIDSGEEDGHIGLIVYENGRRLFRDRNVTLPIMEPLQVRGGVIEVEIEIHPGSVGFSDLEIGISVPSTFGLASALCGLAISPGCCLVGLSSLGLAIAGIVMRRKQVHETVGRP